MIRLLPHRAAPPHAVAGLHCAVSRGGDGLDIVYRVESPAEALVLPIPAEPLRTDGLWRSTCFELFVQEAAGSYCEFNFAPSSRWAAYHFTGRREGMAPLEQDVPPAIQFDSVAMLLSVRLEGVPAGVLRCGVTAVIEEQDGTISYWALRHGGDRPDFHDPDCFVLEVPPAG